MLPRVSLFAALLLMTGAFTGTVRAAETKPPPPIAPDDIYTGQAVVTGKDERNRPLGFSLCFENVLVRASGDAAILDAPQVAALAAKAGGYIDSFSYFDRLHGRDIHDEQGSYDRPHFLTCHFNPGKIDNVLASLGRKAWKGKRPVLTMIVTVRGPNFGRKLNGVLAADGAFDADMREALGNAVQRYGLQVVLPAAEVLRASGITSASDAKAVAAHAAPIAKVAGGDLPLTGDLTWRDKANGWVATWHLDANGRRHDWSARGVSYDEAFRVAVRGAMRALSGNGPPVSTR